MRGRFVVAEDSVSEEEVFGADESLIPESDEKGLMNISLVIGLRDNMTALARTLKTVHVINSLTIFNGSD
jgi:hypothetical protein